MHNREPPRERVLTTESRFTSLPHARLDPLPPPATGKKKKFVEKAKLRSTYKRMRDKLVAEAEAPLAGKRGPVAPAASTADDDDDDAPTAAHVAAHGTDARPAPSKRARTGVHADDAHDSDGDSDAGTDGGEAEVGARAPAVGGAGSGGPKHGKKWEKRPPPFSMEARNRVQQALADKAAAIRKAAEEVRVGLVVSCVLRAGPCVDVVDVDEYGMDVGVVDVGDVVVVVNVLDVRRVVRVRPCVRASMWMRMWDAASMWIWLRGGDWLELTGAGCRVVFLFAHRVDMCGAETSEARTSATGARGPCQALRSRPAADEREVEAAVGQGAEAHGCVVVVTQRGPSHGELCERLNGNNSIVRAPV